MGTQGAVHGLRSLFLRASPSRTLPPALPCRPTPPPLTPTHHHSTDASRQVTPLCADNHCYGPTCLPALPCPPASADASFQGTLFAPTNTAFSDMLKGMGGVSLQTLAKSEPGLLKQVRLAAAPRTRPSLPRQVNAMLAWHSVVEGGGVWRGVLPISAACTPNEQRQALAAGHRAGVVGGWSAS